MLAKSVKREAKRAMVSVIGEVEREEERKSDEVGEEFRDCCERMSMRVWSA